MKPKQSILSIHISFVAICFLVVTILGSLQLISTSDRYYSIKKLTILNNVTDDLFNSVRNFGFERGRVNVVLNYKGKPEDMKKNIAFFSERRKEGEESIAKAITTIKEHKLNVNQEYLIDLEATQKKINELREISNNEIYLNFDNRDHRHPQLWFDNMSQYIHTIVKLSASLNTSSESINTKALHLLKMEEYATKLRDHAGPVCSYLAAAILAPEKFSSEISNEIVQRDALAKHQFQQIEFLAETLNEQSINESVTALYKTYYLEFRKMVDSTLYSLRNNSTFEFSQPEFTKKAVESLERIANLSSISSIATKSFLKKELSEAQLKLITNICIMFFIIFIMGYTISSAQKNIYQPLIALSISMRKLLSNESDDALNIIPSERQDEIGDLEILLYEHSNVIKARDYERSELQKLSQELELIFNNNLTGIFLIAEGRIIQKVNQKVADILGYESTSELEGKPAITVHKSEESCNEFGERFYNSLVNKDIMSIEYELRKKDGSSIPVLVSGKSIDTAKPADLSKGVLWTIEDLSLKKELERKVASEKDKFEKMFRNHSAIMFIVDPQNGNIIDANNSTIDFYGYSHSELEKMSIYDINPMSKNEIDNRMSQVENEEVKSFVFKHKKKDGNFVYVEAHSTPIHIDDKKLLFSVVHDISLRVQHEEAIKDYQEELEIINENLNQRVEEETNKRVAQELLFKEIFNSLDSFVSMIDKDYKYVIANDTYCNVFNLKLENIIGKHVSSLISEELFNSKVKELIDRAFAGETITIEAELPVTSENKMLVEATFCPFKEDNKITRVIVSSNDITERNKLKSDLMHKEQIMIQQSKLADMGSMIAAIAHQWKQPLNVILLSTDLYRTENNYSASAEELYTNISEQVAYLSETINDFRTFFSPTKQKHDFMPIGAVNQTLRMLEPKMKTQDIAVEIDVQKDVHAFGYRNEFMQVIINLINNARDAILENSVDNGKIIIRIVQKDEYAEVSIEDNAGGIPEHLLPDKLFESYVTTKGDHGTGIGLSMAKTIIEKYMDGKISVQNTNEGAKFSIALPARETKESVTGFLIDESIMYVEDDDFTLRNISTLLKKRYKTVYTAKNGKEALELYEEHKNDISIVITDIDMPALNGVEMSKKLREISPDLPIFVVTSIKDDVYEDIGFNGIIEKPINTKKLFEMIQH
jgi:PAS domain S-box-containing protein